MDSEERFLAVVQTQEGLLLLKNGIEIFKSIESDCERRRNSQSESNTQKLEPNSQCIQNEKSEQLPTWILNLSEFDRSSSRQILFKKASLFSEWSDDSIGSEEHSDLESDLATEFVPPSSSRFLALIASAFEEMKDGTLKKIVPCVFEEGYSKLKFRPLAINLLKRLQQASQDPDYKNSYAYAFIDFEDQFALLGITPELLFSKSSNTVNTMAVAGTFFENKGMTRKQFLVDPKETYEHSLVVVDINERLMSLGNPSQGTSYLKSIGKLEHLVTELQVELSQKAEYDFCVSLLHPTAALGVYPKIKLNEWIGRLSCGEKRKYFGSPFGVETPDGDFFCYVAIRNIEISLSHIRIGSGCGVVSGSDPRKEWQELAAKRSAIKRIFTL